MDLATIIGLALSFGLIGVALVFGSGGIMLFIDIPSMLIVFGGTIGATLVHYPLSSIKTLGAVFKQAFVERPVNTTAIMTQFMELANTARREGILALEPAIKNISDPFLRKGLQLTVDGLEPQMIQDTLETELGALEERHATGLDMVNSLAGYAPALGMIGTVIGLVQMLKTMNDPSTIGPAMAVALITTFYGAVLANLVFLPIAGKLKQRNRAETLMREMQIQGVLGIARGENPRILGEKLSSFQPPKMRKAES